MSQKTTAGTDIGADARTNHKSLASPVPSAEEALVSESVMNTENTSLMISPTISTELADQVSSSTPMLVVSLRGGNGGGDGDRPGRAKGRGGG